MLLIARLQCAMSLPSIPNTLIRLHVNVPAHITARAAPAAATTRVAAPHPGVPTTRLPFASMTQAAVNSDMHVRNVLGRHHLVQPTPTV